MPSKRTHRLLMPLTTFACALGASILSRSALADSQAPTLQSLQAALEQQALHQNMLWLVVAGALVFLMQAGFLSLEVGMVRVKNTVVTAMKNIADWVVVSVAFYVAGYGLMFGHTYDGWVGTDLFLGSGIEGAQAAAGGAAPLGWAFVVFQLAFCGTAATIVSGAMAERTSFKAYLLFSILMGTVIYPVFGHWVWGGTFFGQGNEGWLYRLGFRDFAGSSVVHGVGGWAALAGCFVVGPRLGRYGSGGRLNPMESNHLGWSALGVLILWFGWWGFNGGSTLVASESVGGIIYRTNLAAAAAGLAGYIHCLIFQNRQNLEEKFLGSVLGGLVAITACADVVSATGALLVGMIAGPIHNFGFDLVLKRLRIDDVVGAVPVHAICGVWGCLAVGILGEQSLIPHSRAMQVGIQALGSAVCLAWSGGLTLAAFGLLKVTTGIRVDPMREIHGLSLAPATQDADDLGMDPQVERMMSDIRARMGSDEGGY